MTAKQCERIVRTCGAMFAALVSVGYSHLAAAEPIAQPKLRFDGLYRHTEPVEQRDKTFNRIYLRFFADGRVDGATSFGPLSDEESLESVKRLHFSNTQLQEDPTYTARWKAVGDKVTVEVRYKVPGFRDAEGNPRYDESKPLIEIVEVQEGEIQDGKLLLHYAEKGEEDGPEHDFEFVALDLK